MFGSKKKQPPADPAAITQAQHQREEQEVQEAFQKGITALRDFIAPSSLEFSSTHFQIGTRYARTYYVYGYPRQLYTGWLAAWSTSMKSSTLDCTYIRWRARWCLKTLKRK